ncbi:hypothetical protein ACFSSC_03705 [Corynebacterium mendelii]|uniref:Uncharacterized protein n=1 Tax=Corynebacterium mendelii TaxID=2765362 RepID=A0A939IWJ7_9CORY|nr:hypothetical protein [Corynebacterium mendelii]MBN9643490.1 hypothetical protein [Corynebacterium mendelii]
MNPSNTQPNRPPATVPTAIRIGGAFLVLAFVMFITFAVHAFREGFFSAFEVTPTFLLNCAAGLIVGAFFTVGAAQRANMSRLIALGAAVGMIIVGRFVPHVVLMSMESFWLPAYGVASLIAGVLIRNRIMKQN